MPFLISWKGWKGFLTLSLMVQIHTMPYMVSGNFTEDYTLNINMTIDVVSNFTSISTDVMSNFTSVSPDATESSVLNVGYWDVFFSSLSFKLATYLRVYFLPFIVIPGLLGNCFSIAVMSLKQNRFASISWYITMLAVSDNFYLILIIYFCVRYMFFPNFSTTDCLVTAYINLSIFSVCSNYHLVAMTVNRTLVIIFPFTYKKYDTYARAMIVSVIIWVASLAICMPKGLTNDKAPIVGCAFFIKPGLLSDVYSIAYPVINSFIPAAILMICNITIINAVRNRGRNMSVGSNAERRQSYEDQITKILLTCSFTFLICTVPHCVRFLMMNFTDYSSSPEHFALWWFFTIFTHVLITLNASINFCLYTLPGKKIQI